MLLRCVFKLGNCMVLNLIMKTVGDGLSPDPLRAPDHKIIPGYKIIPGHQIQPVHKITPVHVIIFSVTSGDSVAA